MAAPPQKIVLQPGGSVTLQQVAGSIEIAAAACPDSSGEPGKGWVFPKGVVGLRVDDEIVGALSAESVLSAVGESLQTPTESDANSLGEAVEMAGVLPMEELSDALERRPERESIQVLLPGQYIDLDVFKPLINSAERSGAQVEFIVPKSSRG